MFFMNCPIYGYPVQLRKDPDFGMNMYLCMNEQKLCGFVTNNMNGEKQGIFLCDKCDGYMIAVKSKIIFLAVQIMLIRIEAVKTLK